ncbi:uncharacterized protein [Agelaius tricolor]|uniref:uncharacterized protein isoform X3 n=1 Tax=Agelaius tricolor TaxID=9191 RepID=UPI0039F18E08
MGFVDGHKISGALKLSCNSLTLALTFFSDSDGLNVCQRAPSRVRGFPQAGEAPFVSAAEVYMVTLLQHCSLSFFLGSKCGYQLSRQSTQSAIQVAFGSCPGVAASPVATASVSECAQSVRPEQLSVLRSTYSCLRDNSLVPAGASQLTRCRRIKSRAEPLIPGEGIPPGRKSRLRAAVKAEWARWSACHLSWPSMPIPGAVAALGMPRNGGGQVPEATDFPRTYQLMSRSAAGRCVAARSSASRVRAAASVVSTG